MSDSVFVLVTWRGRGRDTNQPCSPRRYVTVASPSIRVAPTKRSWEDHAKRRGPGGFARRRNYAFQSRMACSRIARRPDRSRAKRGGVEGALLQRGPRPRESDDEASSSHLDL